jgi:hypothetical protein
MLSFRSAHLVTLVTLVNPKHPQTGELLEIMAWPIGTRRPPVPPEVPRSIRDDYEEAARVLPHSAKASAALSRRCLQHVLKEAAKTKADWLAQQIDEVKTILPPDIASNLDYVRTIGKFAVHPEKSKVTGEIVDVESGEADWNLDVLDSLFDLYYARPAHDKKVREEFDKKLEKMGKTPVATASEDVAVQRAK